MEQQLCFLAGSSNRNTHTCRLCMRLEHESMLLFHFLYMNIFIFSFLSNVRCYKVTNAACVVSVDTVALSNPPLCFYVSVYLCPQGNTKTIK